MIQCLTLQGMNTPTPERKQTDDAIKRWLAGTISSTELFEIVTAATIVYPQTDSTVPPDSERRESVNAA